MDETYLKVGGKWHYLYRAIDRDGNLVDSMLSEHRDMDAAKRSFKGSKDVIGHKPDQTWEVPDRDRLLGALRRLEDGRALVVTGLPGGRKVVCTGHVSSGIISDMRNCWPTSSSSSFRSSPYEIEPWT